MSLYELSHNNLAPGSKTDAYVKVLSGLPRAGLLSSPEIWGYRAFSVSSLLSFPRHSMVKSQSYWLFKDLEEEFVKDKQICHSQCCPGKKSKYILPWEISKFIFLFWHDFLFWNFTWNRDSKSLPIQVSAVIQLLLIHKISNFMSCFLIHRSLPSVYHYPSTSFLKYYPKHYSGEKWEGESLSERLCWSPGCLFFYRELVYFALYSALLKEIL